ncbi:SurA N-terminal domain-containing protein [Salisediminibacterium beveridgei]|uniref:peptidylprolyl isomerase n=1 Tax=Salisediminibacterium beveridgei TaxID=632773 RepID=A0A1D7QXR5_9BACI|nr:SurA N-terminal domain-containing protein [Salisediminibacterium beveridgei]AOM83794.1 SurA Domain-Containing Protein [Salisediminibacterium beveridgei]
MKKKLFTGLSLAVTMAVVTACGGNDEGNTNEENNGLLDNNNQEEAPDNDGDGNEAAMEDALEDEMEMDMPEPDTEDLPDVVAEVNGEEIDQEEFLMTYEPQFQQMAMQSQMSGEEVDEVELREMVIDSMINNKLLIQEADEQGIEATDEEMDQLLSDLAEQNGLGSADEFMAALEEQGTPEDEIMEQVAMQVKVDQLIANEAGDIEASDAEVEEMYAQLEAQQEQSGGELPPLDEVRGEIEQEVISQQEMQFAQTLIEELRSDADYTIYL